MGTVLAICRKIFLLIARSIAVELKLAGFTTLGHVEEF
jgi:hypothetical protein